MEPPLERRVIPLCTLILLTSAMGVLAFTGTGLIVEMPLLYDLQLAIDFVKLMFAGPGAGSKGDCAL